MPTDRLLLAISVLGLIVSATGGLGVAFRVLRTNRILHVDLQRSTALIARWHEKTLDGPARRHVPDEAATELMPVTRIPMAPAPIGTRNHRAGGRR